MKVLAVCTANLSRSAHIAFILSQEHETKGAGTRVTNTRQACPNCGDLVPWTHAHCECGKENIRVNNQLTQEHVDWADIIFFAERLHLNWVHKYLSLPKDKRWVILDWPDIYNLLWDRENSIVIDSRLEKLCLELMARLRDPNDLGVPNA